MVDKVVTGADIVTEALSHRGQGEVPKGSNSGPFVEKCQHDTFLSGTHWPWCAAFVCMVAKQAGVPLDYPSAGAHDLANHYDARYGKVATASVKPGDVVDYSIGTGHTGIVVNIDLVSSTVTSVDGNWGDAVTEHIMPLSEVRGFWRIPGTVPEGSDKPSKVTKRKKHLPPFVVATSANGSKKILFTGNKAGLAGWLTTHTLSKLAPNGVTITRGKKK